MSCEPRNKFLNYRTSDTEVIDFDGFVIDQLTNDHGVEKSIFACSLFDRKEYTADSNWKVKSKTNPLSIFYGLEAARLLSIYIKEDFIEKTYGTYADEYGISANQARHIWQTHKKLALNTNNKLLNPEQTQNLDDSICDFSIKYQDFLLPIKDPNTLTVQAVYDTLTKIEKTEDPSADDLMICPLTRFQVLELAFGADKAKLYFN